MPIEDPIQVNTSLGTPAASGAIRLPQNANINARNAANNADLDLLATDGADDLVLGSPDNPVTTVDGAAVTLGSHAIPVNVPGTLSVFDAAGSVATTGAIRLAEAGVYGRWGGGNVQMIELNSGGDISISADTSASGVSIDCNHGQIAIGANLADNLFSSPQNGIVFAPGQNGSGPNAGAFVAIEDPSTLRGLAQTGLLRFSASPTIKSRNNAGTADVPMLAVDASDKILLGSSAGTSGAGLDIETNDGPITIGNFASAVTVSAPTTLGITGGATGSRPASPLPFQSFFDTTLHYLVTWDGTNWRNGAGAIV